MIDLPEDACGRRDGRRGAVVDAEHADDPRRTSATGHDRADQDRSGPVSGPTTEGSPQASPGKETAVKEPIEGYDGPQDDEPPPGPSPREVRRRWAEAGDVDALWGLLARSRWCDVDQEDI